MNLYEIDNLIENFEFDVDDETGEIINMDELNALKLSRNEKIENICLFIKNLKSDEMALNSEIKALQDRADAKANKAQRLQKYLDKILNGERFETNKCKISYRKSSVVKIENDEALLDYVQSNKLDDLYKIEIKHSFDKMNIRKYIKNRKLPYVTIEEKNNIQIK